MNNSTQPLEELIKKNMAVVALGQTILQQIHASSGEQNAILQAQYNATTKQLNDLIVQMDRHLQQTATQTLHEAMANKSEQIFKGLQHNYEQVHQSTVNLANTQKKLIFSAASAVWLSALLAFIAGAVILGVSWQTKQQWQDAAEKARLPAEISDLIEQKKLKFCDQGRICAKADTQFKPFKVEKATFVVLAK